MLPGVAILLLYQLTGEVLVVVLHLPFPGPVAGLLLLFATLLLRGRVPAPLSGASHGLLRYLSLLFVPAGVGVVRYLAELRADGLPIIAAIVVSTLLALAVTGRLLQTLLRSAPADEPPRAPR